MPFSFRLAGSVTATVLALSPLPGLAQSSAQAPKPKKPAAKSQPAQPQTGQPVIVHLKPEPAQPDWTKVCGKDERAKTEVCYTTRDFVTDKGQRILAVAVYDAKAKGARKTLRILTPLGFLVPPGVRITVDKGQPVAGRYANCLPHGCFAEATVKDDFVAALKKGTTLNVSARNQAGAVGRSQFRRTDSQRPSTGHPSIRRCWPSSREKCRRSFRNGQRSSASV